MVESNKVKNGQIVVQMVDWGLACCAFFHTPAAFVNSLSDDETAQNAAL